MLIILAVLLGVVIVWLGVLTFYYRKLFTNYLNFTRGVQRKSLDAVLSEMNQDLQDHKKTLVNIIKRCDTMEQDSRLHIQKIGLLRFNPFKDTGGEQSFILSLVDSRDTGVVITALYSRSGTRWYAKRILKGKGVEHELSEEEKKAVEMAKGV
jgi:hypothetical protein